MEGGQGSGGGESGGGGPGELRIFVTLINITVLVRLRDCVRVSRCPMEATVSTQCFELFPLRVSDGRNHCDQGRGFSQIEI